MSSQNVTIFSGLTEEAIRFQLDRILSSSFFLSSPAASRFLSFVVQKVLSGQAQQIKQYTIAVEAFGYPIDFDPHTSTAMRVLAVRLRRMLEWYYLHEGKDDNIRIEIPKNTYIPFFRPNTREEVETEHGKFVLPFKR
jgi:hypothetical protein